MTDYDKIFGNPKARAAIRKALRKHAPHALVSRTAPKSRLDTTTTQKLALAFLRERLADGQAHLLTELEAEAKASGFSWTTCLQARGKGWDIESVYESRFPARVYAWRLRE